MHYLVHMMIKLCPPLCDSLPENVAKNRFRNALPPDHTRVSLHDVDVGRAGADYVIANFVDGVDRPRCYIAAQVSHWCVY